MVVTGIGGVISAINEVCGFWADGGDASVDDCKYILANPLWDKPPTDFAGEFTFSLSSETAKGRGLGVLHAFMDRDEMTRRRVLALKHGDEGTYQLTFTYTANYRAQATSLEKPEKGPRLVTRRHEFRIAAERYYEVVKDSQSTSGFRVVAVPRQDERKRVMGGRFIIPDCEFIDGGLTTF